MKNTRAVVAAALALGAGAVHAQNQLSDLFRVTVPGVAPLSVVLPEGIPAPAPETAIFNLPFGADGLFGGVLPTAGLPVIGAVVMLEPLGAAIDPGAAPVVWPTATGQRFLSDLVISFATPTSLVAPVGVAFISDGDGNLASWAGFLLGAGVAIPRSVLDETGLVQDVTPLLSAPYKVEVQSDVSAVPEPGSAAMWLAGIACVGWAVRRRWHR